MIFTSAERIKVCQRQIISRHCVIHGVESWSGVLEWSLGVDFGVDFGVE